MQLSFPYKPGWRMMALAAVFFAVCAAGLWRIADGNQAGLIINHLIELGPEAATRLYRVLSIVSGLFVVVGIFGVYSGLTSRHVLTVDGSGISAPRSGFSREATRMEFVEIEDVQIIEFKRQVMLSLVPRQGRKLVIMQGWLPDKAAFQAVLDAVDAALRRLHG